MSSVGTAELSEARGRIAATSCGNFALFGGGVLAAGEASKTVDIFAGSNSTWSTATLSVARGYLAAASAGSTHALFAGGEDQS
jgi:hypothetical protein